MTLKGFSCRDDPWWYRDLYFGIYDDSNKDDLIISIILRIRMIEKWGFMLKLTPPNYSIENWPGIFFISFAKTFQESCYNRVVFGSVTVT